MYNAACSSEFNINLERLFRPKTNTITSSDTKAMVVEYNVPHVDVPLVTIVARNVGGAVSVVSAISGSVGSIGQVFRIELLSSTAQCLASDGGNVSQQLSWVMSPTQISLSSVGMLSNFDGALLGNWALISGFGLGYIGASYKFGRTLVRSPGAFNYINLFFASPLASIATTMFRFGSVVERVPAGVSLSLQVASLSSVAYSLLRKFDASIKVIEGSETRIGAIANIKYLIKGSYKWESTSGYKEQYGSLFIDYNNRGHAFMVVELSMNIGTGILDSFQSYNQDASCSNILYATYALYTLYTSALILLRPYISPIDNVYYITISALQVSVLTINLVQTISPELQDNQNLNSAKEIMVNTLYYITLVRGVFDLMKYARDLLGYARGLYGHVHFWHSENKGTSLQALMEELDLSSSEEMMISAAISVDSNIALPTNQGVSNVALAYKPVTLDVLPVSAQSTLLAGCSSVRGDFAPGVDIVPTPWVDAFKDFLNVDTRSEIMRVGGNICLFQGDESN